MTINKALFSSKNKECATPQDLFDDLDAIFHFDLDPCALPSNVKCRRFFTPADDGLKQPWEGSVFMNPPYGSPDIKPWIKKAFEEAQKDGTTVVCLVPARTDTAWWQDYCTKGHVWFVRGRLKFGGSKGSAPFPSAIVIFSKLISIIRTTPPCVTRQREKPEPQVSADRPKTRRRTSPSQ